MSELTLLALQFGFLFVLWVFIFAIVYALRTDLFGQRVRKLQPAADTAGRGEGSRSETLPASGSGANAPGQGAAAPAGTDNAGMATASSASRLVITSGSKAGAEFTLSRNEVTIGRSSDSAIIIRDDYTSTHHARLMLWNDQWMVQDLDSTNGTYLDGTRVSVPTPIALGATVKVGATTFELRR